MNPTATVLPLPRPLPENPYQTLLGRGLEAAGADFCWEGCGNRLRRAGSAGGPSILHIHWLFPGKDPLRSLLRRARHRRILRSAPDLGWKVVWTAHNVRPHDGGEAGERLHRALAAAADGIIAHTKAARDEIRRTYALRSGVEIAVIPHGHFRDAYAAPPPRAEARRRLGLDAGRPVFLAFGQVRPYKGFEGLVDAFRRSALDAALVVAGKPSSPAIARALRAAAGADPRIRLDLRFVPDADVPPLFAAADRVVLPFERITTSGSAILALGFDRPLVLPDLPTLRETAGDRAAEYFAAAADLVPALERALRRDAAAASAAARARADALDWGPIARAHVGFFRSLGAPPAAGSL